MKPSPNLDIGSLLSLLKTKILGYEQCKRGGRERTDILANPYLTVTRILNQFLVLVYFSIRCVHSPPLLLMWNRISKNTKDRRCKNIDSKEKSQAGPAIKEGIGGRHPLILFQLANWHLQSEKYWSYHEVFHVDAKYFVLDTWQFVSRHCLELVKSI